MSKEKNTAESQPDLEQLADTMAANLRKLETLLKATEKPDLLTRHEVAEMLKISIVTVHEWTNKGHLKSYRLGGKVFFKRHEIDAALLPIPKGKGGRT
jgi:excisionase family DNA binding protein